MKLKYLRHPIRTARTAKALFADRLNMWKFARHGARRFKNDARYDLQNVTNGFASRIDDSSDDKELLERICTAYFAAVQQQHHASDTYKATEWWNQVRQRDLQPVIQALRTRNIDELRRMYRSFYRDPCSGGLLGVPYGMSSAYFGGTIKDIHRNFYLSHVLYRLDYWAKQTDGRFSIQDLAGPGVGNPFGIVLGQTFVSVGAEYAHYCAHRVGSVPDRKQPTVAEIGGGFGGMAYYLLRDRVDLTYINFDVPESIALASYYLMKAFPHLKFLLYGESELTGEAIDNADVVLMPLFELANMPAQGVDVTFSSHAMSDVAPEKMLDYLTDIDKMTKQSFMYIGKSQASTLISDLISQKLNGFKLVNKRSSGWHSHKVSGAGVGGAAGLAASTMYEQLYQRTGSAITDSVERSR